MQLAGTYTALITPFTKTDQSVDLAALKKIVEFQVNNKVEGLVPCGTTGESPTLSHKEHREVIAKVVEWSKSINKNCTIIAGTGSNSTHEAIELTKAAHKDGADCALVVNPYYNKPTQTGLVAHFRAIADAVQIPLVLYNIPGRTAVSLSIETIIELSRHPNIIAIKEATGDVGFMTQVIHYTEADFRLLSGDDNLLLPILAIGGHGVISVISNIFPLQTSEITRAYLAGDHARAKQGYYELLEICGAMFSETNPIPVKYAASILGLCENVLRLPLTQLSARFEEKIKTLMSKIK